MSLGRATGSVRTGEQTDIARFWADGAGTYTPPGHWNEIAEQLAVGMHEACAGLATMPHPASVPDARRRLGADGTWLAAPSR